MHGALLGIPADPQSRQNLKVPKSSDSRMKFGPSSRPEPLAAGHPERQSWLSNCRSQIERLALFRIVDQTVLPPSVLTCRGSEKPSGMPS
jgi:hypothetical protein